MNKMSDEYKTRLVPIWIYEIGDLPSHRDNCLVQMKFCQGIGGEIFDVYVPATVIDNGNDIYDLVFHKTEIVSNKVECYMKMYRYHKDNLPSLYDIDVIEGFDYCKIRDGYLVKYNEEKHEMEPIIDVLKTSMSRTEFVKWNRLFDDWRKVDMPKDNIIQ